MGQEQQDRLSFAIIQHLQKLSSSGAVSGESAESLGVACQCLSEALRVDVENVDQTASLKVDQSLQDVFDAAYPPPKVATKDDEMKASSLKDEGNDLMKQNKYEEAIEKYSEAIQTVPNAIYYCNRAAAYSKVGQHEEAVKDAKAALQLESGYSKAYARMGFAYLNMNKYPEAEDCYANACRLDPDNKGYKDNLDAVKEKIGAGPVGMPQMPNMGAMAGMGGGMPPGMAGMPAGMPDMAGMDFNQILSNPAFMNMAQQFMQDPNMQQAFSQMATQFLGAGGVGDAGGMPPGMPGGMPPGMPGVGAGAPGAGVPGAMPEGMDIQAMMNNPALRQMVENIESQNPEVLEQLRSQFRPDGNPPPQ